MRGSQNAQCFERLILLLFITKKGFHQKDITCTGVRPEGVAEFIIGTPLSCARPRDRYNNNACSDTP